MKESMQKRNPDFMWLTLGVAIAAIVTGGTGLLLQRLQGIPAVIGVIVLILTAAFCGYAVGRFVTEASTQSDQGEAEGERDTSL
jgi:purine-cytosine permease-like protein